MFGKKKAVLARERLQRVLLTDKTNLPENLASLIKSDVIENLKNYFDLYPSSVEVKIEFSEGIYRIETSAKAERVLQVGKFVE